MKLIISSKKVQLGQSFTDYAEQKLSKKLDRFFGANAEATLTASAIRDMVIIELTVKHENLIFRSEQKSANHSDAFDTCIDKIIRQIRKNKTKVEKRLHSAAFAEVEGEDSGDTQELDYSVLRTKRFVLNPMTVDEAILQMSLLGHSFFMFKNGESGEVNLVYKLDDGGHSVIEAVDA
ncbi:MAG: ribosome-associated translation inhibitor RaiA [Oscillospiraceae bacterium]|nr:ribosome-associated translation inhibitor RaiA [Oscillospiraceae bacterium]